MNIEMTLKDNGGRRLNIKGESGVVEDEKKKKTNKKK